MDGDTSGTDFMQDLDLWLSQSDAASPAVCRQTTDVTELNTGFASFEGALLTPPSPPTGLAETDTTKSFIAALTDDPLPWTALQTVSPVANGSMPLELSIAKPQVPQRAAKNIATKTTKARKGRPPSLKEPLTKKRKTNKSTSQRQKEELAYLREKAEELESELTTMKQKFRQELERQQRGQEQEQKEFSNDAVSTAMVTTNLQPGKPESSLWERIAKRQRDEKAKAEVENAKLREMVHSQMRLVKSFERLLRKRKIWDQLQEDSNNPEGGENRNEEQVFEDMLRDVDSRYPQVDKVLNEHGLSESDPPVSATDDANLNYSPTDGMYLEYKEKKLMPFDYKVLDDIVWRSCKDGKLKLEDSRMKILKNTDEVLYSRASVPLSRKGSSTSGNKEMGTSIHLLVMKRFVEEERVVYIWFGTTSVQRPRDNGASPVLLVQKGYAIMAPATLHDGSPGSVTRSYTCSVPTLSKVSSVEDSEQLQAQHREVGLLTEMVFAAFQQSRQSINQTLENLILDEMMAKNAVSTPAST